MVTPAYAIRLPQVTSRTTVSPRAFATFWQQRSIFPLTMLAENLSSYSYHFNNIRSTPAYPLLGLHLLCIPRCPRLSRTRALASHRVLYQMLFPSYAAGVSILTILPLLFLIARYVAKRTRRLPWYIDDTLLLFSLVRQQS
jgi:hypothetical protein